MRKIEEIILKQSKNYFFKPIILSSRSLSKYICAFANSGGGEIIFGVEYDGDEVNVVGLSENFYEKRIINKSIDLLNPKPEIKVERIVENKKLVLVIHVEKSEKVILKGKEKYIMEDNDIVKCRGEITLDKSKVFIVHGHDDLAKEETARFIEGLGLEAIILHEQASSGRTIIEKIERYSNVGFGIVIYTPCDIGRSKNESKIRPRARQNVVFEHGYLIGKIGRKNVCALVKSDVERPNDIRSCLY